jgi:class 3 adenylate cyclase
MVVTTLALSVLATINILVIGVVLFTLGEPDAGWAAVAVGVAYGAGIPYFIATGNNVRSAKWTLTVSYINNLAIHLMLGGFANSGGYLAWGIVVCTLAVVIQRKWFTVGLTALYSVTAVVLVFLESVLGSSRAAPDSLVPAILAADFFIASLVMLVPTLGQLLDLLAKERARSERLLLNVLPARIAQRLKQESGVIAEKYANCTVLFADIAGFTKHSREVTAEHLVDELNGIFTKFDELALEFGVEKIKTIGDGYMAVAGAPTPRPDHLSAVCDLALEMIATIDGQPSSDGAPLRIRIGINTGPLVGGVIGSSKFSYDLWGETVNMASRMESNGVIGEIQVPRAVVDAAEGRYDFDPAGVKDIKGEGPTQTYLLRRKEG